ncbi:ATP-binding protein [Acinetobacter baumannii]|nr:ATP-binding protein [Acinetobacter baumannii]
MTENYITSEDLAFRPRARLLQMLGDQLIGSHRLAIFELVKNAYDADADTVLITLDQINTPDAEITIEDNGDGMTLETIKNIWLVPAHDHKLKQKIQNKRSKKGRLPLGEKGLGRFAVHKLGNEIELITRYEESDECVVKINWQELISENFLEDTRVQVVTRTPEVFVGENTGTQIKIRELREENWTRGDIRKLLRQITAISTPFSIERSDKFETLLEVKGHPDWTKGIPDIEVLKERAIWHVTFDFKDGEFNFEYNFRGVPGIKVEPRTLIKQNETLLIPNDDPDAKGKLKRVIATSTEQSGIGDISGEFYIYDRDKRILQKLGEQTLVEDFLDENGGIKVYRDNMRVYNYGEPGDDWLGLDLRRVNIPGVSVSRNIIIGTIDLNIEQSNQLIEKTNREGFVENESYYNFKRIILGALSVIETERKIDKDKIKLVLETKSNEVTTDQIKKPLDELKKIAQKYNISNEVDPLIERTERNYNEMKEVMLNSGFSNMGLAIVFHEIEHGVRSLYSTIRNSTNIEEITKQAEELIQIMDSFSQLLRKGDNKPNSLKNLIKKTRDGSKIRFRKHKIKFVSPFLEDEIEDIEQTFVFRILSGCLTNIIDNAIFWLKVRWPEENPNERKIYIDVRKNFYGKIAIIIADNGPGFQDEQEQLIKPFFSRRPNGMGIGLYYVNLAMELNKGRLITLNDNDDIPAEFDGAALALVFD